MEKTLSISIAAYNVSKTLRECLDPFLWCRVLDDFDIMIVDDGSKDDTAQIANEYVEKYPQSFRLISKENGGWGSTVNAGIQHANGKYFRQLDGDDYFKPENMKDYITFLKNSNADLVVAPYIEYDEATSKILAEKDCNPKCEIGKLYSLSDLDAFSPFMHSIAVKTSALKDAVSITEHCFYTDTEFVLKSINQVHTVMFFDKPIYCYRRASVGQSMSLAGMEKHYMDQTKVIEVLLNYMESDVKRPEVRKIFDSLLFGTCWWQYLVLLYITPNHEHKMELVKFDQMLKQKNIDYYNRVDFPNLMKLRKSHFLLYKHYANKQMKEDKRFSEDGRLLY